MKMQETIVRLRSIQLKNIKNVRQGSIKLPSPISYDLPPYQSEVLGIYGQNGSGKTALVDACFYLQQLMTGAALAPEFGEYIHSQSDTAEIITEYAVIHPSLTTAVTYHAVIQNSTEYGLCLVREVLRSGETVYIDYQADLPDPQHESQKEPPSVDLLLARKMTTKSKCSFLFGEYGREFLVSETELNADRHIILNALYQFARRNLFVIRGTHSGVITASLVLPMTFRSTENNGRPGSSSEQTTKGDFTIPLHGTVILGQQEVALLETILAEINAVLSLIVPGLNVAIHRHGTQLNDAGEPGECLELVSRRDTIEIPIRMESAGIMKLISILNALVQAFADSSVCIIIDELDSGIYEYLLGELLIIFRQHARGQLIFTSHNLRPLEMLDPKSIMFSTVNPDNRYIHITPNENTLNLREAYLRSITLGGQPEVIYQDADSLRIARAFRKAGRNVTGSE